MIYANQSLRVEVCLPLIDPCREGKWVKEERIVIPGSCVVVVGVWGGSLCRCAKKSEKEDAS